MLRTLDYDTVRAEAQRRCCEVRLRAGLGIPKDQPHDDAHWEMQLRADRARLARMIADGTLTWVGPRMIIWR